MKSLLTSNDKYSCAEIDPKISRKSSMNSRHAFDFEDELLRNNTLGGSCSITKFVNSTPAHDNDDGTFGNVSFGAADDLEPSKHKPEKEEKVAQDKLEVKVPDNDRQDSDQKLFGSSRMTNSVAAEAKDPADLAIDSSNATLLLVNDSRS